MTNWSGGRIYRFIIVASYLGVIKSKVALQVGFEERIDTHQWLYNRYAR